MLGLGSLLQLLLLLPLLLLQELLDSLPLLAPALLSLRPAASDDSSTSSSLASLRVISTGRSP